MAYEKEIQKLERRWQDNPDQYFAPLADTYRKAGNYTMALKLLAEGLERRPDYLSARIVHGRCLLDTGESEQAAEVFEGVLDLDPENIIAFNHLGKLAEDAGDTGKAISWVERLLEVDPLNGDAKEWLEQLTQADGEGAPSEAAAEEAPVAETEAEPEPGAAAAAEAEPEPAGVTLKMEAHAEASSEDTSPEADTIERLDDLAPEPLVVYRDVEETAVGAPPETDLSGEEFLARESATSGISDVDDGAVHGAEAAEAVVPIEDVAPSDSPVAAEPTDEVVAEVVPIEDLAASDSAVVAEPTDEVVEAVVPIEDLAPSDSIPGVAEPTDEVVAEVVPIQDLAPADSVLVSAEPTDKDTAESPDAASGREAVQEETAEISPPAEELAPAMTEPEPVPTPTRDLPLIQPELDEPVEKPGAAADFQAQPVVTETMAEVYLSQGLVEQAREVYSELLEQRPDDPQLTQKLAELDERAVRGGEPPTAAKHSVAETGGVSVRALLQGLIAARVAEQPAPEPTSAAALGATQRLPTEVQPPSDVSFNAFFGAEGTQQDAAPQTQAEEAGAEESDEEFGEWLKGLKS